MTTVMESPGGGFPDSPMVDDDMVYPCKGCGEILEEGKAFELAGNRWHIECFRCNTCGTLLDSDANLLLLGDGSLICNNCTYSCSACGNKIEDLAILTGDQAFCASCFRCRNCKRKIENLRYARTSQGIFCMDCHESLMARRRKKSKATRQPSSQNLSRQKTEKSLPALPPEEGGPRNYPDIETPISAVSDYVETPDVVSPKPRASRSRKESIRDVPPRDPSATRDEPRKDNLTLPSTRYKDSRRVSMNSEQSDVSNANNGDDGFFISMALDPNPAPGPSPHSVEARSVETRSADPTSRDYLTKGGRLPQNMAHREGLRDVSSSRSASRDRDLEREQRQTASPHIAYQEKGRQASGTTEWADSMRKWKEGTANNDAARKESGDSGFKLGDVPKARKASRQESKSDVTATPAASDTSAKQPPRSASPASIEAAGSPRQSFDRKYAGTPASDNSSRERPKRSDSMKNALGRKSVEQQRSGPPTPTGYPSATSAPRDASSQRNYTSVPETNGKPPRRSTDSPGLPSRAPARPPISHGNSSDSYLSSSKSPHRPADSSSASHETPRSDRAYPQPPPPPPPPHGSGLVRYSGASEFNMDEEMARVFKGNEEERDSIMRKVSKTVSKHSRSFSDRGSRSSATPKHRQNGSFEMGSPMSGSPRSQEEQLRQELYKANQRIRELETQNINLHERASRTMNIENADSEITKKRATITELETSQHMVLQELEIMENHLRNAKTQKNINMHQLQSSILQDLQKALEETKANIAKEVEELIAQRNSLNEEISNLIQIKNKGMIEYESLSQKNLQLAELNNQLLQNIQETSRSKHKDGHAHLFTHGHAHSHGNSLDATRSPVNANGLGIYTQHMKDKPSEGAVDLRPVPSAETSHSSGAPTLVADVDADPHVLTAPQVVNIRKGKPNKFNWKKGGEGLTKSVTKGIRGAFGGENRRPGKDAFEAGVPYGAMPPNQAGLEIGTPTNVMKNNVEMGKAGFGFFSGQKGNVRAGAPGGLKGSNSGTNLAEMGSGKVLFGSDLTMRCDYERMVIPTIITRCIEEVELRGMDQEGIYRKSGGNAQTKQVREGFEADSNFDISDPDLDIHAVTSAMKQYLRQLHTPLMTHEVYQPFLDAGKFKDLHAMRASIDLLPKAHRDTLEFLTFHLARVMQNQNENLMGAGNLAVVFAPTILIPRELTQEMQDVEKSRSAVEFMLENYKEVFDTEA